MINLKSKMNITINNHKTLYTDDGKKDAKPIILIHGFPLDHTMWQPQVQALKDQYRVITYDVRGLGKSEVGDCQYTMEMYANDLISLMDELKIETAVWCGLSMGGYIILRAIEKYTDRCQALALCDTRSEADPDEGKIKRAQLIDEIKKNGIPKFSDDFLKTIFTPQTLAQNKEYVSNLIKTIGSQNPLGVCGALLAMGMRTDTTKNLDQIQVPTLILVGENDLLTPPPLSQIMHEKIPKSDIRIITNAAHMSNLENPNEFNQHLLEFLNKV